MQKKVDEQQKNFYAEINEMVDLKLKTQEKYDKDIKTAQEKKKIAEDAAAKAEALKEKVDKAIRKAQ
jgi:hypothetical protein